MLGVLSTLQPNSLSREHRWACAEQRGGFTPGLAASDEPSQALGPKPGPFSPGVLVSYSEAEKQRAAAFLWMPNAQGSPPSPRGSGFSLDTELCLGALGLA